jgi:hypothetical protein
VPGLDRDHWRPVVRRRHRGGILNDDHHAGALVIAWAAVLVGDVRDLFEHLDACDLGHVVLAVVGDLVEAVQPVRGVKAGSDETIFQSLRSRPEMITG